MGRWNKTLLKLDFHVVTDNVKSVITHLVRFSGRGKKESFSRSEHGLREQEEGNKIGFYSWGLAEQEFLLMVP